MSKKERRLRGRLRSQEGQDPTHRQERGTSVPCQIIRGRQEERAGKIQGECKLVAEDEAI